MEEYLKNHPEQYLCNPKFRVEYAHSMEETNMILHWVQNEQHPKGKWRVSKVGGTLCCYFDESFKEAIKALQTDSKLLTKKLYNNYY